MIFLLQGRNTGPPISRKLDKRFTEHDLAYQSKTQFSPQSVPPIRKLAKPLIFIHHMAGRGAKISIWWPSEWKPQSQKTNQNDHMESQSSVIHETMSHAIQGHPRWASHGREFQQNVVHWRRQWKTTLAFLLWETHEQNEKAKKIWHWRMNSPGQ